MLQQTQAATVVPYYLRFIERFPDAPSLAAAPLEEALGLWAGLGYYSRLRNLHRAATIVTREHGGEVPSALDDLLRLPGVGRYTAGAIRSIAYNKPAPLLDGNVSRVLTRLHGLEGPAAPAAHQRELWNRAAEMVDPERPGDLNQALMEAGALLCQPEEPRCGQCPLSTWCAARKSGHPERYARRAERPRTVYETHSSVIVRSACGALLVARRPPSGLWAGLYEFPRAVCAAGETPEEAARRAAREVAGMEIFRFREVGCVKHTVTHHRITLRGFVAEVEGLAVYGPGYAGGEALHDAPRSPESANPTDLRILSEGAGAADPLAVARRHNAPQPGLDSSDGAKGPALRWAAPAEIERMPLSAPQRRLLRMLLL